MIDVSTPRKRFDDDESSYARGRARFFWSDLLKETEVAFLILTCTTLRDLVVTRDGWNPTTSFVQAIFYASRNAHDQTFCSISLCTFVRRLR